MRNSIMLAVAAFSLARSSQRRSRRRTSATTRAPMPSSNATRRSRRQRPRDKLVLLISGGDWCSWCHYLAAFLEHEAAIDAALHDVFVVQKVYVGDENMNKEFFAGLPAGRRCAALLGALGRR